MPWMKSMDALGAWMHQMHSMDALGAGVHWMHSVAAMATMAIGETFREARLVLINRRNETRGALHTQSSLPHRC